jgi:SNF2 family DNA or RNA helicase
MFTGKLHPYQVDGAEAILERKKLLVAYSMGTGKTVMTVACLEEMFATGDIRAVLLLVPSSLKFQWAMSIAQFTDCETRQITLKGVELTVPVPEVCTVINGKPQQRAEQWRLVAAGHVDYTIASYGAVLTDWKQLVSMPADALVLDEATAIKNFSAQTSKRVKKLMPPVRIGLTGTPVENKPEELFSLMEWVDPSILGRWDLFDESFIRRSGFGGVAGYKNLDLLHRKMSRAMIRKTRSDPEVAKYLPAVQETTCTVTLDKTTRSFYRIIQADLKEALAELAQRGEVFDPAAYYAGHQQALGEKSVQGKVMARLMALRLLLDHPQLLMDSAEAFHEGRGEGSKYVAELLDSSHALADLQATPKLNELERLVETMCGERAKVAVFTNYRRMLPYLVARLEKYGELVTYHGQMSADEKAAAKARFDSDPDCLLFLSTNAGGYGLDLPVCQYLVNFDLPDSKGTLDQRNTRHVRASSQHSRVYVVNLVVEDSVEERQQATLALRGRLASAIVDGSGGADVECDVESLTENLWRT